MYPQNISIKSNDYTPTYNINSIESETSNLDQAKNQVLDHAFEETNECENCHHKQSQHFIEVYGTLYQSIFFQVENKNIKEES